MSVGAKSRRAKILLGAVVAILVLIGALPHIDSHLSRSQRIYQIENARLELTEELALEYARRMLMSEGLDPESWHPRLNQQASTPDTYLHRRDPNSGKFYFTNATARTRIVSVRMDGRQIVRFTMKAL